MNPAYTIRRSIRFTTDTHEAGYGLVIQVMPWQMRVRAILTIPGNGTIDDFRIDLLYAPVIYTQSLGHPRPEALQDDIALFCQAKERLPALFTFQIQGQAFLVAIQKVKKSRHHIPHGIAFSHGLYLNHFRSETGQH